MATKELELSKIETDGGTQAREKLNQGTLDEYREVYEDTPDAMPSITVYFDGSQYWLADGFHRYHAALAAGLAMLRCEVIKGSLADAQWHASGANGNHGLRRTNADKRRAVELAFANPRGEKMSDRAIAEHCAVSNDFVGRVRDQVSLNDTCHEPSKRVGRDGKEYTVPPKPPKVEQPEPAMPPEPWPGDEEEPVDDVAFEDVETPDLVKEFDSPVKSFIRQIGQIETAFAGLRDANDYTRAFYDQIVEEDFRRRLKNVKNVIASARPHAVCGYCNGEGCDECEQTGALPRGKAELVL